MAYLKGLVAVVLLVSAIDAKPRFKKAHLHSQFRDDWTGFQDIVPSFGEKESDDKEWRNWKDDDLDVDLGEEKVKDLMKEAKKKEDKDISKFEDPCKNVFCHYGRLCKANKEGKGQCVCAGDDFCSGHKKKVCGTDGIWYPSHCELHRMACVKSIHIGINRSPRGCKVSKKEEKKTDKKDTKLEVPKIVVHKETLLVEKRKDVKGTEEAVTVQGKEDKTEEIKEENTQKDESIKEHVPVATTSQYEPQKPPCTDLEFARLKENLLMYHCARIGDNCDKEPARKQFLANIMFSYYDGNNDQLLSEEELANIEHRDHMDKLSLFCSLVDMLTFDDRSEDGNISLPEFYRAFNIPSVVLDESHKLFNTAVVIGNSIELKCDIKGAEKIIWKRNGGMLDDITTDDIKVFEDGSLYISTLGLHHTGNYTCQDKFVDNIVQTHTLSVQMPPKVKVSPNTQFHTTGTSVSLHCHADGVPEPEILWEMNEAPLQQDPDAEERHYVMLHNNATLEIKTATYTKDTGAYKCKARNSAGISQDIATVFIENAKVPKYSEAALMNEAFLVFHDKGYTMYEPSHCHIEHQIPGTFAAFKKYPEFEETLVTLCKDDEPCSWGEAVNVRDSFVYITQPNLNRVVVIELRDRANPVEIIPTDKVPVSIGYIAHLDQVWVLCWNGEQSSGAKTLIVIRQASEDTQHHTVHTQPIGNRFDLVSNMFLPPNNDLDQKFAYGYITHADQKALYKLDLHAMKYAKTISLKDFDCLPQSVAFIPLGGKVMVHCHSSLSGPIRSSRLILDYVTDKVMEYTDLGGEPYTSPDGRHMVVINRQDNTLAIYLIHDNGKLEHLFDEYSNIHVSDVAFFPSERGRGYDFYASSVDKNDVLFINLLTGKVEMIEGVGQAISPMEWNWSPKNRVMVSGGHFSDYLMTPSKDSVVVIDGKRRHVQCEWQDIAHGNVIVWVQPRRPGMK